MTGTSLEAVAEAIWRADPFKMGDPDVWTGEGDQVAYLKMAAAAVNALQLDRRETAFAPLDFPEAVYAETIGHADRGDAEMREVWPFPAMSPKDVVVVERRCTPWVVQRAGEK